MSLDLRFTCKSSPQASPLVWSAAVRLTGLGLVLAVSACAGPAKQASPITAAEQRASQVIIARCLKSTNPDEAAKTACRLLWDVFGRSGVRWAASHLNPDGSLRESRAVFDVTLREQIKLEQRNCMNSWLAKEEEKGPPNLDPALLGPQQSFCFMAAKQFFESASALADEATRKPWPDRTTQ